MRSIDNLNPVTFMDNTARSRSFKCRIIYKVRIYYSTAQSCRTAVNRIYIFLSAKSSCYIPAKFILYRYTVGIVPFCLSCVHIGFCIKFNLPCIIFPARSFKVKFFDKE